MNARFLASVPILIAAGLIGFLFLANLWNFAVERDWPKLRIRSAEPLSGLARLPPTPWTLDAFFSGETQRAVSIDLGRESPLFPISVRAKNQLLYSLLGVSGAPDISIGRDGQLFGGGYIKEFCARGAPPDDARLHAWAAAIGDIFSAAKARGKSFAYVMAPSKPAYMPQNLPKSRFCRALAEGLDTDKLAPFRAALAQRAVPSLDSAALFRKERGNYAIDFFPRGGIHWNLLGAALVLRETTQIFATQASGSPIGAFQFDWRIQETAQGDDRDLLDLLNLFRPDNRYPTAAISRHGPAGACSRAPHLLFVGDSYVRELINVASQAPCPPRIDYWSFMRNDAGGQILARSRLEPGEIGDGLRLDADLSQLAKSFAEADAVLLEENESNIMQVSQVGALQEAARAP